MAAVTGCTTYSPIVGLDRKIILVITPSSADSNDSIDVSSATVTGGATLNSIDAVLSAFDNTTGDSVTATVSGTTITFDASGGTTNHVYAFLVSGK